MSFPMTLCLVLLGTFGVVAALLSAVVACGWRAGLHRVPKTANEVFALRLLPAAGAGLVALGVVLPAFLLNEPARDVEQLGWLLPGLALLALAMLADGIRRGCHAWWAAGRLAGRWTAVGRTATADGRPVDIVDVEQPIVAVLGAWRPRIVAARRVVAACDAEELALVLAHECAHVAARDNLKLLALVASPDLLAWLPAGAALMRQWRAAAELEADARATDVEGRKRVTLAAALVKVARLASGANRPLPALTMPVAGDDVAGRVRQLLRPAQPLVRRVTGRRAVAAALVMVMLAVPFLATVHHWTEALVSVGR
jgi:Zn-dependent protease with chaperone function